MDHDIIDTIQKWIYSLFSQPSSLLTHKKSRMEKWKRTLEAYRKKPCFRSAVSVSLKEPKVKRIFIKKTARFVLKGASPGLGGGAPIQPVTRLLQNKAGNKTMSTEEVLKRTRGMIDARFHFRGWEFMNTKMSDNIDNEFLEGVPLEVEQQRERLQKGQHQKLAILQYLHLAKARGWIVNSELAHDLKTQIHACGWMWLQVNPEKWKVFVRGLTEMWGIVLDESRIDEDKMGLSKTQWKTVTSMGLCNRFGITPSGEGANKWSRSLRGEGFLVARVEV